MDGSEEISGELIVTRGYTPEILESAEAALDDVAALVGASIEAMQRHAVRFVGNDGSGAALDDERAEGVAVVAFIGEQYAHRWRKRQDVGGGGDVGVLAWRQMNHVGPTESIAQRMNFRGASAARAPDRLRALPPFPPLAERCALIEVESSESVTESLPLLAKAVKIASHRPRLAQRLKRL